MSGRSHRGREMTGIADARPTDFRSSPAILESLLRIESFHWCGDAFRPALESDPGALVDGLLQSTQGRFSVAHPVTERRVVLARDKLGMNKLFFAVHEKPRILASNYLVDLVERGVPLEAVYSVPAGHVLDIDVTRARAELTPYFEITRRRSADSWRSLAGRIRQELEMWFSRLSDRFGDRRICVCLSGGLDSSVIAALARRHFGNVTAYTYGYVENGRSSEDAYYGEKVSDHLGLSFRFVPASRRDILGVVDDAIRYGQDWRDFNVHCAIVNEILARAIADDSLKSGQEVPPLVLTGDLMNEFLADYSSVFYYGKEYYRLPRVDASDRRVALVRGLDAGDREVGVFSHHGLDVIQPYAMIVEEALRLPGFFLDDPSCKQNLLEQVAGDLLPAFVFERVKTRAQVGSSSEPTGVLPVLAERGYEGPWLRKRFCGLLGVPDEAFLRKFIRLGRYRFSNEFLDGRRQVDGYYAG